MADVLGPWAANIALPAILDRSGLYLGLHLLQPTDEDGHEVLRAGYARQPIGFLFGARAALNDDRIVFAGMPGVTANFLAVWTQISDGFLVFSKDISANPLTPDAGDVIYVMKKDLALAF